LVKDEEVAKALLSISRHPEGEVYLRFLREQLAESDKRSRRMSGDELLIENGKRLNLEMQVSHFEAAKESLERIEGKKKTAREY